MESVIQLINEWEIQLLVLLSFTLQVFLFFTGNLRRYSTNMFLRVSIWSAYLGADSIAIYALGYLSRHGQDAMGEVHLLTFFWAPFLIIHLGGQDTITAFAIEDNNLWLRHLLTLIEQVALALYVFWKSIGRHNLDLLVPGIFLFVSGIIRYGERTLSLMYGSLNNMSRSTSEVKEEELPQTNGDDDRYSGIVRSALLSALYVRDMFAGSTFFRAHGNIQLFANLPIHSELQSPKLLEVQLGMMYDDLYTKAILLRTRSGIVLRCISQISAIVAFVLFFLVSNKQRYSRADVAITYVLLVGGFFLDVCAAFILIKSPWSWAWLKARKCHTLATASWFLFSSKIGWAESKPLWSTSLGQYSLLPWVEGSDQPTRSCKQQVWAVFGKMINLVGIKKEKLFWISKLLDIKNMEVDEEVMYSILELSIDAAEGFARHGRWPMADGRLLLKLRREINREGFAYAIVHLHIFTEVHLRRYAAPMEMGATGPTSQDVQEQQDMVGVCRKLSNYMMYLLATNPEMLPVTGPVDTLMQSAQKRPDDYGLRPTLKELRDTWILFLAYAAGKSRPEMHAARLGKGGELITFVWMFMARHGLGDAGIRRIELMTGSPLEARATD